MTRLFLQCCLVLASLVSYGYAFVQPTTARNVYSARMNDNNMEVYRERVSPLSLRVNDNDDEVNVNLIPDVDAFTLTAVGFGLIAFNFLVLANMGDMGVGGVIARVINTFSDL